MSENNSSFLDGLDLDNAVEPTTVPDGTECVVVIKSAEVKTSQKNSEQKYINVFCEIEDMPTAKDFNHMMMLPNESTDPKQKNNWLWQIKAFAEAFTVPYSGGSLNLNAMNGRRAWAILSESDDPKYGKQNRIKQFVKRA